ncbi:MAG: iron complex outermembrane receptor protein [Oleiphilaceae bacterium]|jgi:iron complex outermembrane receptor protein
MTTRRFNKITQCIKGAVFLGAATTAAMFPATSFAQQAEGSDDLEVIQVRGIRASQKAALNQKRFSNAVVDSISAEDIGKFPDRNIAESLQRVPGVAISRNFAGEGGSVSIRGTNPELTLVTMNGNYVASTGWFAQQSASRSFDMDLLPPELVAGVDVFKSPMASLDEGGVGGTVEVRTRKPLDLDAGTLYLSAEVQDNSLADDKGFGGTGMYSWKNDDENFGVLAVLSTLESIGRAHKAENYLDDGWAGAGISLFEQDRKRDTLDLTVEYAPTDALSMNLHYLSVDLDSGNTNENYLLIASPTPEAFDSGTGSVAGFNALVDGATEFGPDNGRALHGTFNRPATEESKSRNAEVDTRLFAYEINYEADTFTVNSKIGNTKATGGDGGDYVGVWQSKNPNQSIDFDFRGANSFLLSPNGTDPSNHAESALIGSGLVASHREDEETFAQVDLNFDVEWGPVSSFKTGVKLRDHEITSSSVAWNLDDLPTGLTKADFADGQFDHSGIGLGGSTPSNIAKIDGNKLIALYDSVKKNPTPRKSTFGVIKEDIFALYAQGDFNGDSYRGNVGLRYVQTDTSADFFDFFDTSKLANEKSDYADWLPSFNLALDLSESVILRVSAAKVISRPNYTFLNPAANIVENTRQISRGTVALDPFRATQADIGLEWYFNDESLVAATLFNKDIQSFITPGANKSTIIRPSDNVEFILNEPGQGLGGQIQGAEFQYQQQVGHFGWSANFTYTEGFGLQDLGPENGGIVKKDLAGLSKFSYNLSGFYENDVISTRLAYTYRDDFIAESTGIGGATLWDAHGFLDANITWHVTEQLDVSLESTNLLDESTTQRLSTAFDSMRLSAENGRNVYLKVAYRL